MSKFVYHELVAKNIIGLVTITQVSVLICELMMSKTLIFAKSCKKFSTEEVNLVCIYTNCDYATFFARPLQDWDLFPALAKTVYTNSPPQASLRSKLLCKMKWEMSNFCTPENHRYLNGSVIRVLVMALIKSNMWVWIYQLFLSNVLHFHCKIWSCVYFRY